MTNNAEDELAAEQASNDYIHSNSPAAHSWHYTHMCQLVFILLLYAIKKPEVDTTAL
jgi:hypothetical protein